MDMPQVRRIELFAFPFLLGTVAVSLIPESARSGTLLPSGIFLLCAAVMSAMLLTAETRGPDKVPLHAIFISSALCAAVCMLRAETAAAGGSAGFPGIYEAEHGIIGVLSKVCIRFKAAVDRLDLGDGENNALLKALLTGDRSCLSAQTTQAFRDSGASHILALSGLHLGIIYAVVTRIFSILGNSPAARKARSVLNITACGGYCLMVGAAPSISRAFLFIFLRETARLSGRSSSLRDILWDAFIIQMCIDATAARSLSFQLSYLAVAGIAYIYPPLNRMWPSDAPRLSPFKWIWNSVCLSVSCQLTTGPLAYLRFGTVPKYFIMTNLLTLPLTGLLIPAALTTTLLNAAGLCPQFLLQATALLAKLLRNILEIIAAM